MSITRASEYGTARAIAAPIPLDPPVMKMRLATISRV
jgi:hypothetical protein